MLESPQCFALYYYDSGNRTTLLAQFLLPDSKSLSGLAFLANNRTECKGKQVLNEVQLIYDSPTLKKQFSSWPGQIKMPPGSLHV